MTQPVSNQHEIIAVAPHSRGLAPVIVLSGAGFGVAILIGALVLWFHYGTAVFFEMLASGIAACF